MAGMDDVQKEVEQFVKDRFGGSVKFVFPNEQTVEPERKPSLDGRIFDFNLKPKDIKHYLDRFVIKQDDAKKALCIAICDHYNHVMRCLRDRAYSQKNYAKQNIVMLGPTGVGKTYLVRQVARLIGVPFVKADATRYSETGYVGAKVEDLVRELVTQAGGNIELAQHGIIYIDEVDKLASSPKEFGKDVSGRGVQSGLLKLMEETEIDLRASHDMVSQIQTLMEYQRKGKLEKQVINTRNILFIVSGAFVGLSDIIKKRLFKRNIGINAEIATPSKYDAEVLRLANTQDFMDYGFEPEFVGRLPVQVICEDLSEVDLYLILKTSEGSIINQYEESFKAYGIDVYFTDESLKAIARKAHLEKTGARGLVTVCEKVLRNFKFELSSSQVLEFVVTDELINQPDKVLGEVLRGEERQKILLTKEKLSRYCQQFHSRQGVSLELDDSAVKEVHQLAQKSARSVIEVCEEKLKGFEHGLNLIRQNSGKNRFVITKKILSQPEATLEKWIKDSYLKKSN